MPDIVVDEKSANVQELLQAASKDSVPSTMEVKQIERARRRRQLEQIFAQSKYAKDRNMQREFYNAIEWEDRMGREEEFEYCQQLRLDMVKRMMNSRKSKMQNNFNLQMGRTISRLESDKEKKLNTLR